MLVRFPDVFPLKPCRYHEVTGAGSYSFAAICCGLVSSRVLWFAEGWVPEVLNPNGLQAYCDPHQLLVGKCGNAADVLAATEEALRSGAVPLVVAELTKPLTLTSGRRLQLAAEAGASTGLMIVQEGMGSNATQTRWRVSPRYSADVSTLMQWELIKNKAGTCGDWRIDWNDEAHRISVVSEPVQRANSAHEAY
ncbi:hypothetical protein KO498_16020 [Lentibacter algarum]|uniref:ImuA family protein n=1 Tax=Lentibacter algarum TaxID=576131 RepID=UPI001C081F39|nr:hypothetical protein [Lentibacter algarum]MBU2983313.1 hypothetical protein [Lentibacter algarum]